MEMNYKVGTNKTIEEAVKSLKIALAERDFGVLVEHNFQETLKNKGVDFDKRFILLEVCNPFKAKIVLDEDLEMAYFLPCKVGVYEINHQVYIGMPLPTKLMGMTGNSNLFDVASEVEDVLLAAIDAAK